MVNTSLYFGYDNILERSNCTLEMVFQFILCFLGHQSACFILCMSIDRYARIKYLNSYQQKFAKKRFNTIILITVFISIFIAALEIIANFFQQLYLVYYIFETVSLCILVMMMTVSKIKSVKSSSSVSTLNGVQFALHKLSMKILAAIFVFYTIYLLNFLNTFCCSKPNLSFGEIKSGSWQCLEIFLDSPIQLTQLNIKFLLFSCLVKTLI